MSEKDVESDVADAAAAASDVADADVAAGAEAGAETLRPLSEGLFLGPDLVSFLDRLVGSVSRCLERPWKGIIALSIAR